MQQIKWKLLLVKYLAKTRANRGRYPGKPVDEVEPGNGNLKSFGTAKQIFEKLEEKQQFYGGKEDRLESNQYVSE